MDALILSCGTGGGHNAAGNAIKEELLRRGHGATMINPYDLCSKKLSACVDKTYISIAQRAPHMFGAIYAAGNFYRRLPWRSPVYFANKHPASKLLDYLQEKPADVVIMPHVFPAEILTYLRDHGATVPKTIFVATDYTCIPFTEECSCDAYVIPSESLTDEFVGRGIPAERIHPLGIPVRSNFRTALTAKEAKEKLGLDPDKRYILLSGVSIGASKLGRTLDILSETTRGTAFGLIVICGSNEPLRKNLEKRHGDSVRVIGHTDQMALYLRACELFFTKPGGLSTTEAAVMEVPLALLPPIPGCETRNLQFFTQSGMGAKATLHPKTLTDFDSAHFEALCAAMQQNQRTVIRKNSAEEICDLAEKLTVSA